LRVLLVYNPTAGGDGTDLERVEGLLEAAGHGVLTRSIKDDDWAEALHAEIDLVAVAGGDGTVRKVFKQLAGTSLPATLLPVGTANNIARSLGFPEVEEDAGRLIERWAAGPRVWCDLGKLTFAGGEELFVESAGGGLFGEVLTRAKASGEKRQGEEKIEFGLCALREIVDEASPLSWGIRADGRDRSGELLGVAAMNVRELGPKVPVAPHADPGDGLLELTLIEPEHRSALEDYLDARIDGRPAEPPALDVSRARGIELEPPGAVPLHVDDELADERGAIAIEVNGGLHVLVPAG
jgi:diacylglycerol kinase family enzyme